jgi:cytochrome c oxidase subunit 4
MADTDPSGDTPRSPGDPSGDAPETSGAVATDEPAATPELTAAPGHGAVELHAEHSHPSPAKYVGIAILLAIVTALEVALYYIEMPEGLFVAFLMVLAFIKFTMVAAFFMHLKFDSPMLRRVFILGIVLAGVVYTVALLTLRVLV